MKEIIDKISSYNLFNYLFPGVVFVSIIEQYTSFAFTADNIMSTGFLCYFIGMVISRVGSITIAPLLRKIGFVKNKDYGEFVQASKLDSKIDVLSEQNNVYRTIISMIILIALTVFYDWIAVKFNFMSINNMWVLLSLLFVLFLLAYRKQSKFICKRIDENLNN